MHKEISGQNVIEIHEPLKIFTFLGKALRKLHMYKYVNMYFYNIVQFSLRGYGGAHTPVVQLSLPDSSMHLTVDMTVTFVFF